MLVTPKQMQILEQHTDAAGVSYAEMMERAGRALADCILTHAPHAHRVVFLAGTGNNGGDCYVAAHYLHLAGVQVQVLAPLGEPKTEISRAAAARVRDENIPVTSQPDAFFRMADVAADGLFGTGFRGQLPEGIAELLSPHENQLRIAVDIPSGGSGLTGSVSEGTFQADVTVTFGAVKIGMTQYPLREYCGTIHCADIGIPDAAFAALEPPCARHLNTEEYRLPSLRPDIHKNSRGHLLTIAGSVRMRGACVLAAAAAMRSGVGLQTLASAEPALQAICARMPEIMCLPLRTDADGFFLNTENHAILEQMLQGKQALLIGCGMGVTENTKNLTKFLLEKSDCPVILDADGLNCLTDCIEWIPKGRTVLTPHPGEAARLLGMTTAQVQADRPAAARLLAERTGAVTVLKGAGTIITDGEHMAVCTGGNAGMARAGSGDVLAGMTAALCAQSLPLYEAACTAVTLHASAGDAAAKRLPAPYMLPQDLIEALQEVL